MKDLGPTAVVCRLSVSESKLSDTGSWMCELSNSAGKTSSTCSVKVVDVEEESKDTPLNFEELLSNVTVAEHEDAVFRCKVSGKPAPEIKWFRDDVPVDPSFRHEMKEDEAGYQTLTIRDVRKSDTGIYKAKFTNTAGWTSCDSKLSLALSKHEDTLSVSGSRVSEYSLVDSIRSRQVEPVMFNEADVLVNSICDTNTIQKFLIKWKVDDQSLAFPVHLRNKCAVEGTQAVLSCLVSGAEPIHVRWFKDNREVFDGEKYFIRKRSKILSLDIPILELSDTGQYMCIVRNDQGKIFTSCYLQVEPRLENLLTEVPIKPFFTKPMKRQTVNEGELIIFRVAAKAHPPPGFKWFKDAQELHDSDRINTEVIRNGVAQLTIHMAKLTDIGLYVCEAHNHAGRARSMVRLSVRDEYEAKLEAAMRPIDYIEVSTRKASAQSGQQNGNVVHEEPSHAPKVESEIFPREPIFNISLPKTIVIRDRGRFILECNVCGVPKPKVQWMKGYDTLQEDDRLHFLSVGNWYGLEVLDAQPRDEGIYTVKLDNSAGLIQSSCRVEMKLPKEEPKFFQTKEEALAGFYGRPKLQLLESEFPWHQFDIPTITPSFHLCNYEVDRIVNSHKEICIVDTLEAPKFTKPLPDMVTPYESDNELRLACEVSGKPCPNVVWFKDEVVFQSSEKATISWDSETKTAALVIKTVGLDDSGKYTCIAYSDVGGHAITTVAVQVRGLDYPDKEKETNKNTHPEFKLRLEDKAATPGDEVRLEVKAEGFPTPEVTWFKNTEPITAAIDKYSITSSVEGVHTLLIPSIHLSDEDCYKCEAKNDYGSVTTCAHVKVQEGTEVHNNSSVRPYFEEPLHSISVSVGEDAMFKCAAKGNPTPVFKWLKQGPTDIDQDRVKVEVADGETKLTLKDVNIHDGGLYYCFANNSQGTVKSCASLTVRGGDGNGNDSKVQEMVIENKNITLYEEELFTEELSVVAIKSLKAAEQQDKTVDELKADQNDSVNHDANNESNKEPNQASDEKEKQNMDGKNHEENNLKEENSAAHNSGKANIESTDSEQSSEAKDSTEGTEISNKDSIDPAKDKTVSKHSSEGESTQDKEGTQQSQSTKDTGATSNSNDGETMIGENHEENNLKEDDSAAHDSVKAKIESTESEQSPEAKDSTEGDEISIKDSIDPSKDKTVSKHATEGESTQEKESTQQSQSTKDTEETSNSNEAKMDNQESPDNRNASNSCDEPAQDGPEEVTKPETTLENATLQENKDTKEMVDTYYQHLPETDTTDNIANTVVNDLSEISTLESEAQASSNTTIQSSNTIESNEQSEIGSKTNGELLGKSESELETNNVSMQQVPKFICHPKSQWVTVRSPLELTFAAEKSQNLTVTWNKDGESLKDDRFQMVWE